MGDHGFGQCKALLSVISFKFSPNILMMQVVLSLALIARAKTKTTPKTPPHNFQIQQSIWFRNACHDAQEVQPSNDLYRSGKSAHGWAGAPGHLRGVFGFVRSAGTGVGLCGV